MSLDLRSLAIDLQVWADGNLTICRIQFGACFVRLTEDASTICTRPFIATHLGRVEMKARKLIEEACFPLK